MKGAITIPLWRTKEKIRLWFRHYRLCQKFLKENGEYGTPWNVWEVWDMVRSIRYSATRGSMRGVIYDPPDGRHGG